MTQVADWADKIAADPNSEIRQRLRKTEDMLPNFAKWKGRGDLMITQGVRIS